MILPKPPKNHYWSSSTNGYDRFTLKLMYRGPKTLYLFDKEIHNTTVNFRSPPEDIEGVMYNYACRILDSLRLDN